MKAIGLKKSAPGTTAESLRILLLEKSPQDAEAILKELRNADLAIECTVVTDRGEFEEALGSIEFAAVLAADSLPGWNGIEALHFLRDSGKDTPFLLLTGSLGEEAAAEFIRQGFNDYVWKDRLTQLPVALKRALEEKRLREANARAQDALAESEARNRELVENSSYGIFRVSLAGAFLYANASLLQLLACKNLEDLQLLNLSTDVFRYPEEFGQLMVTCRQIGFVHSAETELRRKDGGLTVVRLHLRYLSLPGPADALEGIVEDVTELRALERQLQQAQKFETIGQLAGGIAHDFNNVIGAILGWAELGHEQSRAYPAIAERFARIREQADRAAELTRELLAFARRQALQPRPVDLNRVMQGLVSLLDKVIDKSIEIKVVPGSLPPVKADPTQIEQVAMNLCLNARDAMPQGGQLVIETELVQLDESYCRHYPYVMPGCYAVLSVSDTGLGMDEETRERIFEPFFTTKERGKGTGIGLATVYGIVKQHGGFIHVYSEPGQGSLFRVYLPAMEGAVTEGTLLAADSSKAMNLRGTETILLAEDHDSIREMARQSLMNLGYRVLAANDGEQAVRLCEEETPSLAVLDVVMPHLGGPATAAQLLLRFPGLPILFTSGYSEHPRVDVSLLPTSRYLQKPYSPTSLGRTIREILGGPPSQVT
ncbi:MAG TPA: response regulator [Candidatus Dormibacteraeota bacterium]|nr:response regulator [Candidatus Dormibacteraeota bacterium]